MAVDGPAGSGKSSICREAGRRLGWGYINTGAIYRALAVLGKQFGIDWNDEIRLAQLGESFMTDLNWDARGDRIFYRGEDISDLLQTSDAGQGASKIAKFALVREKLLPIQRHLAEQTDIGVLVDGRDIGTVVFPQADLKIFMTASLEQRARRRLIQLNRQKINQGNDLPDLEQIKTDIAKRDFQDQNRGFAPLKAADDALIIDTSDISFDESVEKLVSLIKQKGLQ